MTVLVLGATGATGRLLVEQLLSRGQAVRAIVRSPEGLPEDLRNHEGLSVIRAAVLDLSDADMARHVAGCDAVASCLGHTLSFRGMFGHPRRLVTDAVSRFCGAIRAGGSPRPTRFVLMNTTANVNRDLSEKLSLGDRTVLALLHLLLPPHADNVAAAEFLRTEIGRSDPAVEWVAVRPDNLIDEPEVTEYVIHASPTRGVIFGSGQTSRINVAHFMASLITDDDPWGDWKGRMPVISNRPAT